MVVILSILLSKKLRTSNNALVFNLALANLIVSIFMPLHMTTLISGQCYIPEWLCAFIGFVTITSVGISAFTLMFIALYRCSLITGSFKRIQQNKTLSSVVMIGISCIIPITLCSLPLYTDFGDLGFESSYSMCLWVYSNPKTRTFTTMMSCFAMSLTLLTTIFYLKLYIHVRRHNRKIKAIGMTEHVNASSKTLTPSQPTPRSLSYQKVITKRQIQVTKNMFLVLCLFNLTFVPTAIMCIIPEPSARLVVYTQFVLAFNACVNPIIYTKNPEFRKTMMDVMQCRCSVHIKTWSWKAQVLFEIWNMDNAINIIVLDVWKKIKLFMCLKMSCLLYNSYRDCSKYVQKLKLLHWLSLNLKKSLQDK